MPQRLKSYEQLRERSDPVEQQERAFYWSIAWRQLRQIIIAENPICQRCNRALSTEVHHRLTRRDRPDLELEPSNLEATCKPCHSKLTRNDGKGNPKIRKFGE